LSHRHLTCIIRVPDRAKRLDRSCLADSVNDTILGLLDHGSSSNLPILCRRQPTSCVAHWRQLARPDLEITVTHPSRRRLARQNVRPRQPLTVETRQAPHGPICSSPVPIDAKQRRITSMSDLADIAPEKRE